MIRILLPALFLLFPLAEIACFILVGRRIGLFPTLSLVILSGVAGVLLMRLQGLGTLAKLRETARRGESPGRQVLDTAMIVVAARRPSISTKASFEATGSATRARRATGCKQRTEMIDRLQLFDVRGSFP